MNGQMDRSALSGLVDEWVHPVCVLMHRHSRLFLEVFFWNGYRQAECGMMTAKIDMDANPTTDEWIDN